MAFTSLVSTLMKAPIHAYRAVLSPVLGPRCRHLPSCSEYALEAITKNGPWLGGWLMAWRIARCNPFGTSGYDPAPDLSELRIPFWAFYRVFKYGRPLKSQTPDEPHRHS